MNRRSSKSRIEPSLRRTERFYLWLFLGPILALVLLVGGSWGGYRVYSRWQEHQSMREAHDALEKGNFRWASLAAQRALSWEPESLDACRVLAEIGDRQLKVEAIDWRRRAVNLRPGSLPDLLALAETALRFSRPILAKEALDLVPPTKRADPAYHSAAAHLALAQNDFETGLRHLTEAARLSPGELTRQLELAQLELRSEDSGRQAAGRARAERLRESPEVQLAALNLLLDDALRTKDAGRAVTLAKKLIALPQAPFAIRLAAMSALRAAGDRDFFPVLDRMEDEASSSGENAARLVHWMNLHGLALLAVEWSKSLPASALDRLALRSALADSYLVLQDWDALGSILKRGPWSAAEPLRLALEARVARADGDEAACEKSWAASVKKAGSDRARLEMLHSLAARWNWPEQAAAILWRLAEDPQTETAALRQLFRHYTEQRDTAGLFRTIRRLAQALPEDRAVQNNLAQISLLLDLDPKAALSQARQLHESEPQNAAFASTYAFALYRGGEVAAARDVMRRLSPEQLQDASVALYYGVILAATKNNPEASRYLKLGEKASLLPEEQVLLARAQTQAGNP